MQDVEKEYDQLVAWTNALLSAVAGTRPQVLDALNPSSSLLPNCPSHASMAAFVFHEVKKKLDEVVHSVDMVEKAIWKSDS